MRISLAPGQAGRPDAVNICTFRPDGWLDGSAALVRITDGPAQILVTIYQNGRQRPDTAPRLQVLKLSGDAAEQAPAQPALIATPQDEPEILAHVQRTGDIGGAVGDWIGLRGSGLWVEGFGITAQHKIDLSDIEYQGVLGRGWLSPWVEGGKYCGSRGMALPLLGLTVRLKGDAAKAFDCTYSATFVDGSAVGPVPAGQVCEADSLAALEAFQIQLHPRDNQTTAINRGAKTRATARGTRR